MRNRAGIAPHIVLSLFLLLVFLFTPLRVIRIPVLFLFLTHAFSFLSSLVLPRALAVSREEMGTGAPVVRVNRQQRFTVSLVLRNRLPFPVRSALVVDAPGGTYPDAPPAFLLSFGPRETRVVSWSAEARERGEFTVGPVTVSGPGPLGFHRWSAAFSAPLRVVVYPAVFPLALEHRRGLPAGNIAVLNRLYEDVTRFRSLREYTPGDELRRINWKVSARMGKLHTMEYLPSLYFPVLVLLNLSGPDYPIGGRYQLVERAIEAAGSLVVYFTGLKQEIGLVAAARIPGEGGVIAVPMGRGYGHGVRILEALARARSGDEGADFENLALGSGVPLSAGTRIVAVTPPLPRERRSALRALARRGYELEVFFVRSSADSPEDATLTGSVWHAVEGQGGVTTLG